MTDIVQDVLSKLDGVYGSDNQWNARCPCRNDDEHQSLRVGIGKSGQVLLCCQKGNCNIDEICQAIGIKTSDLWPNKCMKKNLKLVDTYSYTDAEGNEVMQVRRYTEGDKKTFRQCVQLESGEIEWSTSGISKPLYRLPRVLEAVKNGGRVYVVEGEKDVHTMESLGHIATCNPGGASSGGIKKWTQDHTDTLAGAGVVVVADNDEAGDKHARYVCSQLLEAGSKVRLFRPKNHKDVTEIVDAGLTLKDGLVEVSLNGSSSSFQNAINRLSEEIREIDLKDPQYVASRVEAITDQFIMDISGDEDSRPAIQSWAEFLNTEQVEEYDWIIPGLLERQERVMIVAAEGVGKTTLSRQVALLSAAGIHPFSGKDMPKITTLTIDLENPERIIRRTSSQIHKKLKWMEHFEGMDAHLVMKPEGVDLLRAEDRMYIESCVAETNPDILFMGPMYKTFLDPGNRTSESIVLQVVKFLDRLRTVYNTALWLEHHAPLGHGGNRDLRPFGSAVWSRWSEFGVFLRPSLVDPNLIEFDHYRGQREERRWPKLCAKGKVWPFEVLQYHGEKEYAPMQLVEEPQGAESWENVDGF